MLTYFCFLLLLLSFFNVFSFELYLLILCPGPPEINPELKNQSIAYNSSLPLICFLESIISLNLYLDEKKNSIPLYQIRFKGLKPHQFKID